MISVSEIGLDLSRLNYELEEDKVNVLALKDYIDLRIDGINLNLVKDQDAEVPFWLAKILEEKDIVKIQTDLIISPRNIRTIAHQEGEKRSLSKIDSLLYRRVRTEIERLRKLNTNSARRKLTSIEGSFNTILRLRFRKVLNLAIIGQEKDSFHRILTKEEEWLYLQLNNLFQKWNGYVGANKQGE